MRLVLTGRNLEITSSLRQLIERRLARPERMLNDSMVSAQVVLSQEKYRRVVEIAVHVRGDHTLHGTGNASAWQASITEALDKIAQQAHKVKDRWETRKRRAGGTKALRPAEPPAPPERTDSRQIVRARRYPVKPMSIDDAAARVEAGPDSFLVFRNTITEAINIMYRRKDGRLGLIDPEA
jgi:putative sigma-54 modulation protein